ncbi:acyl-CoA dehydrogenase family protein [Streptomyces halobius]|uniref:Acyl-CoA oxidase n=1 Tax=Streptomyces halobius TaxID=2879846 RepID=A0ABY4M4U6_9ACTN|nr:acyl-CoA dehydrogenase [Streptomyces halobius]UQA91390.1 acyl-CoA oxidase [Streptomyces halobius]
MPSKSLTPPVSQVDSATADALSKRLFDSEDFGQVHEPWRQLIATPEFRYEPGLSPQQRTALSYRRLRAVNAMLAHSTELASDAVRLAGAHEWIAAVDPTCASLISIHHNLYVGSLAEADENPLRVVDRDRIGVFLTTETGAGNDAAELQTTATWDPDSDTFELHTPHAAAQKQMPNTSPLGGGKDGVVAARLRTHDTDHGVLLFHVPITDDDGRPLPGIRIRQLPDRSGDHPLDHCLTSFDRVQLPRHALLEGDHGRLDAYGRFTSSVENPRARFLVSIRRVTAGRLAMSASSISIARTSLDIATRYAHHRYISGRPNRVPIAAHRTHSAPLISRIAQAYAMTLIHRQVLHSWAQHDEHDRAPIERDIAIIKAWNTWRAREIATECRERCGALGLFPGNGIAGLASAVDGAITAEGDNVPIMVKAGAEMLFDHEVPPAAPAVTSLNEQLTGMPELRHLLAVAEEATFARARARFCEHPRGLARWNRAGLPAVEAMNLHAAGMAGDAFIWAAEACRGPQERYLVGQLGRLFLLQQLAPHTGPLMADGHLTGDAVKTVPDAIEECIAALTPHMLTLTTAFMTPDGYLAAIPIAHPTYQQALDDPEAHWNRGTGTTQDADLPAREATPWSLLAMRAGTASPNAPHRSRSVA